MKNEFIRWFDHLLTRLGLHPTTADLLDRTLILLLILFLAWLTNLICKYLIIGGVLKLLKRTHTRIDSVLRHPLVLRKLSSLIPAIMVYMLLPLALSDKPELLGWLRKGCVLYAIVIVLLFFNISLKVLFNLVSQQEAFRDRPLKGLLQLMQVGLICVGIILFGSILFGKTPLHLLAGLGASAAVLMLVFRDSILGFVSGIQLSVNDMLKAGDWITMPQNNVDGTVLDVSLTTVKIENFDNTITTIPPYMLTSGSFQNWRGMMDSSGRRIMRSINIDINSVRFCTPEMLDRYRRIALVRDYIDTTEKQLAAQRTARASLEQESLDTLRQSNLTIFRAYATRYIESLPVVNTKLTLMVRELQPSESGIPVQLYCFSSVKEWVAYEGIQADIFDHILSVLPLFDLYVFQSLSGQDLQALLALLHPQSPQQLSSKSETDRVNGSATEQNFSPEQTGR